MKVGQLEDYFNFEIQIKSSISIKIKIEISPTCDINPMGAFPVSMALSTWKFFLPDDDDDVPPPRSGSSMILILKVLFEFLLLM